MAYCHLCGKDEVDGLCPVCDPSPPKKKKSKTKTAKEKVAEATEEATSE